MSKQNKNSISGSQIKLNVNIDPLGDLHMEDYEFECKFYIFPKKFIIINKSEMVKIDSDNYVVLVDTTDLGVGRLHMMLTAQIPDEDFGNEIRREVACVDTGIDIVNC